MILTIILIGILLLLFGKFALSVFRFIFYTAMGAIVFAIIKNLANK
jgi:hypothetical protein